MPMDLYRAVFDRASDAIIIHRIDGTIVEANSTACRVMGLTREQMVHSNLFVLQGMEGGDDLPRIAQDLQRNGHAILARNFIGPNGETVHLEVNISVLESSDVPLLISIARDLTARKKAESDLKESDEKLRNFADLSSDGFYMTDEEGRVVAWSHAMERITGLREEDARDKRIWDLHTMLTDENISREMAESIKNSTMAILRTGEASPLNHPREGQLRRLDGKFRHIYQSSFPVRTARGFCLGGITRDITEQKEHEEALKASEARYRLLTENVRDVIYRIRLVPELRIDYASPAVAALMGFAPGETVEALAWALGNLHPEDKRNLRDSFFSGSGDKVFKEDIELRLRKRDGSLAWVSLRSSPVLDGSGNQVGIEGVAREITREKEAEEALRRRVQSERLISSLSTEFLSLSSRAVDDHLGNALERVGEVMGMERGYIYARPPGGDSMDLVSSWMARGISPEKKIDSISMEELSYFMQYLSQGDIVYLRDASVLSPLADAAGSILADQGIRSVAVAPMMVAGELHGFVGFDTLTGLKDLPEDSLSLLRSCGGLLSIVIERRNVERELSEERERLAVTLRSIGDGVITTDVHGRVMLMNRIAEDLTGWRQEEAAGQLLESVFKIVSEETREPCEDPTERVLRANDIVTLPENTVLIDRDGTEKAIADSAAPITDREGRTIGVVLVFRDVTGQRRMEEMLASAQKLEAVGTLAGGIAHDFNNILTIILGNISAAKLDAPRGSRQSARLTEAEKGVGRARGLTQQLLTFSEGGDPVKKVVPLANLIRDTVPLIVSGSKVLLDMDIPEDLGFANIDEDQIAHALGAIAINSVEAMPEGGRLSVEARNVCLTKANAKSLAEGDYIRISLRDDGPGIPKHILANIFEPYVTTKKKGSGLGLPIAYSVINKHAGSIEVISEEGRGAEFVLLLPAAAPAREEEKEVRPGARVLILDDEESILEVTGEILRHLGYDVETAVEGREALETYRRSMLEGRRFDVVIMDLTIPGGMGGKEVIKHLLVMDPRARAIVSSGYSNDPVMSDFKGHGFVGVVPKPYRLEELEKAVRSALPSASA